MLAPLKLRHFQRLQSAVAGSLPNFGFTADKATITPSITLLSGTADWLVVEGDGSQFTYNTAAFSHARTDPGAVTVLSGALIFLFALIALLFIKGDRMELVRK